MNLYFQMKLEHRKIILKAMPYLIKHLDVDASFLSEFETQGIFDDHTLEAILVRGMGNSPYSEGPLIRRFYSPTFLWSEGSIVRRFYSPNVLYSEDSIVRKCLFRGFDIPKVL